jgi:hypothetical protein
VRAVVEEDALEGELEGELDRRVSTLEARARELVEEYGRCRAAYILRKVHSLEPRVIARLLNANPSTVRNCIAYHAKRDKRVELLPPLEAFKRYKELCRDAYSLECQSLEAEIFVYNVAREATPVAMFWSIFVRAASIHRVMFPEVYRTLEEYARASGVEFGKLLRAYKPKGSPLWRAGDGVVAYAYALLELAHYTKGLNVYRFNERLRAAIIQLTGLKKDPLRKPIAPLVALVALKLATVLTERWGELRDREWELEREIVKALRERKGGAARSQPP